MADQRVRFVIKRQATPQERPRWAFPVHLSRLRVRMVH
jgi:hypothetical protein